MFSHTEATAAETGHPASYKPLSLQSVLHADVLEQTGCRICRCCQTVFGLT